MGRAAPGLLSRRRWLASVGAGALVGLGSPAAHAGARRILLLGSSTMGGGFGLYLENDLRGVHGHQVHRFAKPSTSLSRPDFFDWQGKARELVETHRPEISVVLFGGNEVQGIRLPDGGWIRWQEPGWAQEYGARVGALADTLGAGGSHVFWIGSPVARSPDFSARLRRINTIYRAEMAIRRRAWFVDTWGALSGSDGTYSDHLEVGEPDARGRRRRTLVRAPDGIHTTVAGAHVLKDHVLKIMLERLATV